MDLEISQNQIFAADFRCRSPNFDLDFFRPSSAPQSRHLVPERRQMERTRASNDGAAQKKKQRSSTCGPGDGEATFSSSKQRLVIVVAGFAGLSAARTLLGAAGERLEVIVLEASSNVGGRARSATVRLF